MAIQINLDTGFKWHPAKVDGYRVKYAPKQKKN